MQLESLAILEGAGIPHNQALAMLQVIDMEIRAAKAALSADMVATLEARGANYDLHSLRLELASLQHSLESKIEWTRRDLKSEIEWTRRSLKAELS